ncbi:GH43_33 / GH43 / GH43_31 / GH43_30 / GH43_ 34 / GH43_8 / GH43_4 / GH43_32 / GH43_17 / GH117 [uncultured Rubrobacteraceae bacterium]|uniref:GH43_33 / GH43 / GH43_31 / GH43_30 / GH43_ 34 / GH43_8 / GH43_4 / GH43_32 / GH43_17 / GH117 n=1 Tax=uncultured Rubrobacteraceae bacterium TaxID=349277 RepID=A0A6J4Q1R8_9ACTN|nr:GH43_33 / GH43 / GH43_31 / GH43_30 / GH43_ 34 / GH43_8 / GH43_4 / GH43_32 / GH43_17 / GH117 [uncultured Rubrobacteraceae bacterium]
MHAREPRIRIGEVGLGFALSLAPDVGGLQGVAQTGTNATYYNAASFDAADPYVLSDERGGYYYAYSTDGGGRDASGRGYHFGIYRSADLATWEQIPGGALPVDDGKNWADDWFWAPEIYHNSSTGLYFLFYSARSDANARRWFGFADFEEPCKVGVAVARSPEGPFSNIARGPIDYWPYDPGYHDVNRIMGPDQTKPPATLEEGRTAPLGVYIPFIDPNVFFDDDGRLYLYYSRNAYRNWVWDYDLGKYIEESNIYAVELEADWWNDAAGRTMPAIKPSYVDANRGPDDTPRRRRDGFVRILDYERDRQPWENAHVNDYATSGGTKKDRRWEEGSTTVKTCVDGADGGKENLYYLTYSANNWQNPDYGVGYATATNPLGPWKKYAGNPILAKDPSLPMYSTGHGSIAISPDGSQAYYVHHGRPSDAGGPRKLYTGLLFTRGTAANGNPALEIDQTTGDRPVPAGVAPYSLTASKASSGRGTWHVRWQVRSVSGARLALGNPLNRVAASLDRPGTVTPDADGRGAAVTLGGQGAARLTLTYQRKKASGVYEDVCNIVTTSDGAQRRDPVSVTVELG